MLPKRILYLGYYLKQLDWKLMKKFIVYTRNQEKIHLINLWIRVIYNSLRYNISLLEYFQFGFWKLTNKQKIEWVGTGYMYEFQRMMNPIHSRNILDNKVLFAQHYKGLIRHLVFSRIELIENTDKSSKILNNPSGKIVLKVLDGKCGKGVEIKNTNEFKNDTLVQYMQDNGFDLVEEFIVQHKFLSDLSPSAVNTVRIFTQLDNNDQIHILGCRLRISINSPVDNLAAGNAAAPIDENTGLVDGPAVFSDITRNDIMFHPVTNTKIEGFQIPFWDETMNLAKKAAWMHPQNRSVGWDIAITPYGPDLIEGNHDWCKLLWQLPVRKGLKPMLENF
jgi:hypothetical protein